MASHDVPEFKEVYNRDWVYFGKHNEYPYYLLDLYNRSSKHAAIVNGKTKYVFGQGFGEPGEQEANKDGETLNDIARKCILDCEIFGGFYLEAIWSRDKTTVAEWRHLQFSDIRSNKDNTEFYWSEKWAIPSNDKPGTFFANADPKDVVTFKPFDPEEPGGKQIFYYRAYRPGFKTYPLPEYQGAIVHIDSDVQVGDYWNNTLHNGFSPSAIINFYNGEPSEKEKEKIENSIKEKLTGARGKKFVLNFTDLKEKGSDIQVLEHDNLDGYLETFNKTIQQEIFTGHHVTSPMLFGIKTEGQLGGRTELIEANELFQNLYVTPKQQLFEKLFKPIAEAKGIKGDLKLGKIEPIGYMFSESTMIKYLPERAIVEMVSAKMGIDLKKYPEHAKELADRKAAELQKPEKFSAETEKAVLLELKKRAKKRVGKVWKQRPVEHNYIKNLSQNEEEQIQFAETAIKSKDPSIVPLLVPGGAGGIGGGNPTITGPGPASRVEVVYTYQWRDAIPEDQRDTEDHPSREFCKELMEAAEAGYTWSRQDINDLSYQMGFDVWQMRGGWYTKPGTDVHLPYCRHIWMQQVVIR